MRVRKVLSWIDNEGRYLFLAVDFGLGALTFFVVLIGATAESSLRESAHLLNVSAGLGIAVLAVVLTALAILVAFLDEGYVDLISATSGGVAGAIRPYKSVAVVAGLSTVFGLLGSFFWPVLPEGAHPGALGISAGLAVWGIVGTVELVTITADHGRRRARMPELYATYKKKQEQVEQERERSGAAR